ncbi:hypothetical protein PCANB_001039 [Pneumocystis canis]|nr:hypothetical protein PCK1_000993 [Pneumocystis canis]KAG5437246.1 hypothetical protein PCANB_001039 [Pneumocystis canis]
MMKHLNIFQKIFSEPRFIIKGSFGIQKYYLSCYFSTSMDTYKISNNKLIIHKTRFQKVWKWLYISSATTIITFIIGTVYTETYGEDSWLGKRFYIWFPSIERLVLTIREDGFDKRYPDAKKTITEQVQGLKNLGTVDAVEKTIKLLPYLSAKTSSLTVLKESTLSSVHSDTSPLLKTETEAPSSKEILPKILPSLPLILSEQSIHPSVQSLIDSLNIILTTIQTAGENESISTSFETLKSILNTLNVTLQQTDNYIKSTLNQKLSEQKAYFEDLIKARETTLQTQATNRETYWMSVLQQEYERLERNYRERLEEELKKHEEVNEKKLKNELIQQAIELQRRWIREMKARVEEQRGRRLGQLEHLYKHIKQLEIAFSQAKEFSKEVIYIQRLQIASQALRKVIEDPQQKSFTKELYVLKELSEKDEFMQVAIHTIQRESHEQGIMSKSQLTRRFYHLADEIHKVSLCPDHTGVLGYITSRILTFFMFKRTNQPNQNYVQHILSRTETYLQEDNLDAATRELNQLKGVPKRLASDWLKNARQNLEVIQALNMIETYTLLQSILLI